ncbi:MAG TPA: hypothetical protein VLE97_09910 [Gaiellaceae bacterium]|nr:hypothetical protein [Gaiellaceae bacterium]
MPMPTSNQRGQYGSTAAAPRSTGRGSYGGVTVGGILFHTVGDRDALLEQTNTGWTQLARELITRMGVDPTLLIVDHAAMAADPAGYSKRAGAALAALQKSPLYPFWRDVVSPEYEAFNKFYANQSSWEEWKTDYSTYENWAARLESMRKAVNKRLAEANAAPLAGPSATPLPKTVMEKGGEAVEEAGRLAKGGAEGIGSILKYGVIGALVIGGAVVATSLATNLKKGKDPIEHYAGIYRQRRA